MSLHKLIRAMNNFPNNCSTLATSCAFYIVEASTCIYIPRPIRTTEQDLLYTQKAEQKKIIKKCSLEFHHCPCKNKILEILLLSEVARTNISKPMVRIISMYAEILDT